MAAENVAQGLMLLGKGFGQIGEVPELQQRIAQREQELQLNEQRQELNQNALKTAREQAYNARISNIAAEFTNLEPGARGEFFNTKSQEIDQIAKGLGVSPEEVKLRVKSPSTLFQRSKEMSIKHLDTQIGLVDSFFPDLANKARTFKSDLEKAQSQEELDIVKKNATGIVEDLFTAGLKLQDKKATAEKESKNAEDDQLKTIRGELDNFTGKFAKKEFEQLGEVAPIRNLLDLGNSNQAAFEMSKTMLTRLAGDPRPSDRDLARISPNPSFINAFKRTYSRGLDNVPLDADVNDLRELTKGLEDATLREFRRKAKNYADQRKGLIPGISSEDLEKRILISQGLAPDQKAQAPIPAKSSQDKGMERRQQQVNQQITGIQGVISQLQKALTDPNVPEAKKGEIKAKIQQLQTKIGAQAQ